MMKNKRWLQYTEEYIINKKENPNVLVEEDLSNILNEIGDNDIKNEIFETLIKLKNYSPFIDAFPAWEFNKETQKKLIKLITYIKTHYFINNDIKLWNGIWGKIVYKSKNFNIDDYANDVVIAFNSHEFEIYFLNKTLMNNKTILEIKKYLSSLSENNTVVLSDDKLYIICNKNPSNPLEYETTIYENNLETIKNLLDTHE